MRNFFTILDTRTLKLLTTVFVMFFLSNSVSAQKFTINGYVKDGSTGETVIGALVFVTDNPSLSAVTNTYGFYSITLPEGTYKIQYSYIGYSDQVFEVILNKNTDLNVELAEGVLMEEVVISSSKDEKKRNIEGTQMGTISLPVENIKKLPAIFGEVDVLKAIQLLPGVLSAGEGTSGFYVRGGGPDQNLVLLDEALVYNSGHLLGFFSVFNADAIKNTTLITGGMPANFGGRLSSVLDIQMKEGNNQGYEVEGGIGLISSRLTVQGPIQKDKSSFVISGRRTYILDLLQPALKGGDFEGTNYYFYDLNTKWNYRFSDKNRLYFSGYFGNDVLKLNQPKRDFTFSLPYGNKTGTLRWNHLFSQKLFMNVSAIYNDYKFEIDGGQADFNFKVFSGVKDWNLKVDFENYYNTNHTFKFGLNYTYHTLTPNTASASNGEVDFKTEFEPKYANEYAAYFLDDMKLGGKWALNTGLRLSAFQQVGPYTSKISGERFGKFDTAKLYGSIEPRVNLNYKATSKMSIKAGIAYTTQYIHLVSNSSSTLPADVWVPSTEIVKPQRGVQYSVGWFRNFLDDNYETSIETYYKDLRNQIDYSDSYVNDIRTEVEDAFLYGKGRAYGLELFIKKSRGKLNGWIGYSLSKTERSFDGIEGGRWYPAVYDRPHDFSLVANYKLSKKWDLGLIGIYGSGKLYTPIRGFFLVEQNLNLFYGPRNSNRLDAYHRIDISATYTPKPSGKRRYAGSWNFSVYNIYNRKNPFFISFDTKTNSETGASEIEGSKITLFPMIPSITYNFRWNQK